jgi:hypothetical protein
VARRGEQAAYGLLLRGAGLGLGLVHGSLP